MKMLNKLTKLNKIVDSIKDRPGFIRYGQALWNECEKMFPNEVELLRDTKFDPYYKDERSEVFVTELIKIFEGQVDQQVES